MPTPTTLVRAIGAGFAAGVRTMTPIAAVSAAAAEERLKLPKHGPLSLLTRRDVALISACAAAAEWFVDAVFLLPPRTIPPTVVLRMSAGAVAGAAVATGEGDALLLVALVAALASLGGTYGGHALRRLLTGAGVSDLPIALAEDFLALSLSFAAVLRTKSAVA